MAKTAEEALNSARKDLAERLGIDEDQITGSVEKTEFPDMALGAPEKGELSGQMITSGWRIRLTAKGTRYEYRADKRQIRLCDFKGRNWRVG
ncbi:MAG TPA: hypothetical protein VJ023_05775 [Pyrinomonadaceae bacterium]|nr:hypothetical protein [Pyrinomonadaceae bacterium]